MIKPKKSIDIATLVQEMIVAIQNGTLADEKGKLPGEYKLMDHYQVSRYALREALGKLNEMGYLYQARGVGSFVRPRRHERVMTLQNSLDFTEEIARQGRTLQTVKATQQILTVADADFVPENYQLSPDLQLIEIERYRTLDDEPYQIEKSYYLKNLAEEIPEKIMYNSVFHYFEQEKALKIGFLDKVISCAPLMKVGADFFNLPVGAPTLIVRDDTFLISGELFAFSKICYDYRKAELFMFKKTY